MQLLLHLALVGLLSFWLSRPFVLGFLFVFVVARPFVLVFLFVFVVARPSILARLRSGQFLVSVVAFLLHW